MKKYRSRRKKTMKKKFIEVIIAKVRKAGDDDWSSPCGGWTE